MLPGLCPGEARGPEPARVRRRGKRAWTGPHDRRLGRGWGAGSARCSAAWRGGRARELPTGRGAAVEVLQGSGRAKDRARFRREVAAVAARDHPNGVPVDSAGEAGDGRPFSAMELVGGGALRGALAVGHGGHSRRTPRARASRSAGVERPEKRRRV